jgi:hypothetical protein
MAVLRGTASSGALALVGLGLIGGGFVRPMLEDEQEEVAISVTFRRRKRAKRETYEAPADIVNPDRALDVEEDED